MRAAAPPTLPPQVTHRLPGANAAPGKPPVDATRHQHYLVPIHVQEQPMLDQSNEQQRIQRRQGLLLLAWEGEGAVDDMLAKKPAGTVRIRLDIGRGTGTFAARIRERNVTVVTTTMKPRPAVQQLRGIEGVGSHPHRSAAPQPLSFFNGTLDLVHSMHVLSNWLPDSALEFARRVQSSEAGWNFLARPVLLLGLAAERNIYADDGRGGFQEGEVGGVEMDEWYLSALLERPMT